MVLVFHQIYEYINLELPIIAALPYGDAADIINNNKFGFATLFKYFENSRFY